MFFIIKRFYFLIPVLFIFSCGGGGGGGGDSSPSTPLPAISFSAENTSLPVGGSTVLTWSSTNANSCTASGGWSGTKATSGSEDIYDIAYGSNSFSLSCSGPGGNTSASLTINGTQAYDATAFVGGTSKYYRGFLIHKKSGYCAAITTVEFELKGAETALIFDDARAFEARYICYYDDAEGNSKGISLSEEVIELGDNDFYSIPIIADSLDGTQGIYLNSVNVDPFNYDPESLDDLEQFSADLGLDFQVEEGNFLFPDLRMGVLALPNSSPTDNTSSFMGYSENSDESYTVLYLAEKDLWDENSSSKPSEGSILVINFAEIDLFTAYQSLASFIPFNFGLKVNTELVSSSDHILSDGYGATVENSRRTDKIDVIDNQIYEVDAYGVKYLTNSDAETDIRLFLKMDMNVRFGVVQGIDNYEIFFFSPDKESVIGFKLGGYDDSVEGRTNMRLLFNND